MYMPNESEENTFYLIHTLLFNDKTEDPLIDYKIVDNIRRKLDLKKLTKNQYTLKNDDVYLKYRELQNWCPSIFEWCNIYYYENYIENNTQIDIENFDVEKDYDYMDDLLADKKKYTHLIVLFAELDCRNLSQDIINILNIWRSDTSKDVNEIIENVPKRLTELEKYADEKSTDEYLKKTIKAIRPKATENEELLRAERDVKHRYTSLEDFIQDHSIAYNGYDVDENKNIIPYFMNALIKKLEKKQDYNSGELIFNKNIKTKLYDYQIDNIHWMINRENNPINDYFTDKIIVYFPDGRLWNYCNKLILSKEDIEKRKTKISGGVIADTAKSGKTLQIISLALSSPKLKTLVIVPKQNSKNHWDNEIKKHLKEIPTFIEVITYEQYNIYNELYDRLVIDNFEKICYDGDGDGDGDDRNEFRKAIFAECSFKWCVTSTPFLKETGLLHIMRYLTNQGYKEEANKNSQNFINKSFVLGRHYEYLYPLIIKRNNISDENKEESDKEEFNKEESDEEELYDDESDDDKSDDESDDDESDDEE